MSESRKKADSEQPAADSDDDTLTTLQTTRAILHDMRKIASIEEIPIKQLTNRVLGDYIAGYAGGALAHMFRTQRKD